MAFERFSKDARAVVLAATREEARLRGSGAAEAEHLLLALSAHPSLKGLGLDHDRIEWALAEEEARSLAAVGVAADDSQWPTGLVPQGRTTLATSAKLALGRALVSARRRGERRIQVEHLLRGVLAADHGRVPRALRIAGLDADELRAQL